jgi:hypothetical protein
MTTNPLACWICGKAIDLNTCKTDEQGLAVHELCYATRIALKLKDSSALPVPLQFPGTQTADC